MLNKSRWDGGRYAYSTAVICKKCCTGLWEESSYKTCCQLKAKLWQSSDRRYAGVRAVTSGAILAREVYLLLTFSPSSLCSKTFFKSLKMFTYVFPQLLSHLTLSLSYHYHSLPYHDTYTFQKCVRLCSAARDGTVFSFSVVALSTSFFYHPLSLSILLSLSFFTPHSIVEHLS